jgi:hypothetical protein
MSDSEKDPTYLGTSGSFALFALGEKAVIIDTTHNLVVQSGPTSELTLVNEWEDTPFGATPIEMELASASLVDLDIKVVTAAASRRWTPERKQSVYYYT